MIIILLILILLIQLIYLHGKGRNIMKKVFVSGGSGFISLHLISKLIQEGYQVRTSLRSLDRKQEVIDAVEKEVSTKGMLEFCELDLLKDGLSL